MNKAYWIRRKRAWMASARAAHTSEARLFHYDMAGRHSIRAAHCPPFLLVESRPASAGEGEPLRIDRPLSPASRNRPLSFSPPPGAPGDGA